ncbi:MAG: DUF2309 domain-containing protein [Elusimicrobia bacterium]|nr:DUF2309 domain-containing protein [Elusimicrobiota bacterium]
MSKPNAIGQAGRTAAPGHESLEDAVARAAHCLPAQGPIGVFIHHNTLHAFQHLPFEEAVQAGARRFGTEPFLTESAFRSEFERGRILAEDLVAVLAGEADSPLWPGGPTRRRLRRLMLSPGLRPVRAETIDWMLAEGGLLDRPRDRALYAVCLRRTPAAAAAPACVPVRPREALLAAAGVDSDEAVNARLIRDCSAFFDQGVAAWPMPGREGGFYRAVACLSDRPFTLEPSALSGLGAAFRRQAEAGRSPAAVVLDCLNDFRVPTAQWESLLTAELLALPGWAGLMHKLEHEPALAPHAALPCALMDFLAVRLTLTRVAVENAWTERGESRPFWTHWRDAAPVRAPGEAERAAEAARLFDAARLLGLTAARIESLTDAELEGLRSEIGAFGDWERRRVWHLAYERRHELEVLRPLAGHRAGIDPRRPAARPFAQVVTCLDEREESFRRAVEEHEPAIETLGAAGFFSIAVHYQGLDDPHGAALCPVVVTPRHAVTELPREDARPLAELRRLRRRLWAAVAHGADSGSRSLLTGWAFALVMGLPLLLPLLGRAAAPRLTARARGRIARRFVPAPATELALRRADESSAPAGDGLLPGFTVPEQAERIAALLRAAGLTEGHARLVALLGHGSTSLNNPHESAHDCGACGGRRGAPNARIAAAMANDAGVRARMADLGVRVPSDTWFVGGYHDTCSDEVSLFDTDLIPAAHAAEFERLRRALDAGRAANAHERARRFEAADDDDSADEALRHVEDRAARQSEPRPEYGHATNAVAVIGRRSLTRGLFLDRRAFLVSYDPDRDPKLDNLAALLGAGGPVCAGINLEYYFSVVDNERYGCGTKLPHNVTGLVGVMNGPASDLRTGLPWQMVEVHEPVRLLVVVENTPERVLEAARRSPAVVELVANRWIRLATIDPDDGTIRVLRADAFVPLQGAVEPPTALSSVDWYRGKLEHLPIAHIASTTPHPLVEGNKA